MNHPHSRGFTLFEISLVILIIGVLASSVFAIVSLTHSSKVLSAMANLQQMKAAILAFRTEYEKYPGDFQRAAQIWEGETQNGNGNGRVEGTPGTTGEDTHAWRQLFLAGIVETNYTGTVTAGEGYVQGQNIPGLDFRGGGIFLNYMQNIYNNNGNAIIFALIGDSTSFTAPSLTREEARNIDVKLDDGMADTGEIVSIDGDGATETCVDTDDQYQPELDTPSTVCTLIFWLD